MIRKPRPPRVTLSEGPRFRTLVLAPGDGDCRAPIQTPPAPTATRDVGSPPAAGGTEPLLTAAEVALLLRVPLKAVYKLPLTRIMLSPRRYRWRRSEVETFLERRTST